MKEFQLLQPLSLREALKQIQGISFSESSIFASNGHPFVTACPVKRLLEDTCKKDTQAISNTKAEGQVGFFPS